MNNLFNTIATILIFVGIILISGSANDCDGKCVETANTLGEMLKLVSIGLFMMITGGAILFSNSK